MKKRKKQSTNFNDEGIARLKSHVNFTAPFCLFFILPGPRYSEPPPPTPRLPPPPPFNPNSASSNRTSSSTRGVTKAASTPTTCTFPLASPTASLRPSEDQASLVSAVVCPGGVTAKGLVTGACVLEEGEEENDEG